MPPAGPEPPKLSAFVSALEATAGRAFAPLPWLKRHLPGAVTQDWARELPDTVVAKVLRVGARPLQAAIVVFTDGGYERCTGPVEQVAIGAVEHASASGQSQLEVRSFRTEIRVWFEPQVVTPPHFTVSRAFFVRYAYDADKAECLKNPNDEHTGDERMALFKLGPRGLVPYMIFNVSGNGGEPGYRTTTTTQLEWHVSKQQVDRVHLSVVVEKTKRIFNTEGSTSYERYSCQRAVSVIAMERGKLWRSHRGTALARLRKAEPDLAKLPQSLSGHSRKACPF